MAEDVVVEAPAVAPVDLKALVATAVAEAFAGLTQPAPVVVNSQGQTLRQVALYGICGLAAIAVAVAVKGGDLKGNDAMIAILSVIVSHVGNAVATAVGAKATSQPTGVDGGK